MVIMIAFDFKKRKQIFIIREKKQIGDYCYVTVIHNANNATTSENSNP
jgi:hypothetical protein